MRHCVPSQKEALAILMVMKLPQSDFHAGHPQNQNVTSASSNYISDYKQGYKDGWNDAQYSVNVLESSIC